jgi:acetyl-CoA synthetase
MSLGETAETLDSYRLHEQSWESYEQLREEFTWDVPEQFNLARYLCDRWVDEDSIALVERRADGERGYTYGDLQTHANRLANFLQSRGVEAGDRVAVNGAQRVESLVTHLAAWKLGAVSVPLSVLFGPDALGFRLSDSDTVAYSVAPQSLEAFRAVQDECDALETALVLDDGAEESAADERAFWDAVNSQDDSFETTATAADDAAMILYTSGTTGAPKGVVRPHQGLLGILPAIIMTMNMEVNEDDVVRSPVEWSWAGSLNDIVMPGLYFGQTIIADDRGPFEPDRELALLEEYGVTVTGGPPTAYRFLLQHPAIEETDLSSLRVLALGGEAAGQTLVEMAREKLPDAAIHEVYGQSEAPLFVTDCEALDRPHREGKMGVPAPGHEVTVRGGDTDEEPEAGQVGEFALRYEDNPICFTEYWNRPDTTAEKVRDGWMYCEDLGSIESDGYLKFHSRKDDVIISSGYKVSPAEIEDTLAAHDAVANAGVIGIPDETRGELVKAFVVLAPDREPSDDLRTELQTFVKERLAKYEYPRELAFVDELPKTSTGKVRRKDLREREGIDT